MQKIKVNLKDRSYYIKIGFDIISELSSIKLNTDFVIISHSILKKNVVKKISEYLKSTENKFTNIFIPEGESAKSFNVYIDVINKLFRYEKQKKLCLLAVGGGVAGDITGFVAGTYKRGIPYVQIPTTLLSAVDSSVGGKTGINLSFGKNLIGCFYQPALVLVDISFLRTLPEREIKSGLAEVVKYGIIEDVKLFEYLEKNYKKILNYDTSALQKIIFRCLCIKSKLVELDEKDQKGKRIILNLGHTIGHSIENSLDYSGEYNHGEAVALGILIESEISRKLGLIQEEKITRIEKLFFNIGLPCYIDNNISINKIFQAMKFDKKFISGKNRFVLPVDIGKCNVVEDIEKNIIKQAIYSRMRNKL